MPIDPVLQRLTRKKQRGGKKGKRPRKPRVNGLAKTAARKRANVARAADKTSKYMDLKTGRRGLHRLWRAALRENGRHRATA